MIQLLPFMLFAFVASITPGPTNVLVLGSSARYGVAATLPLVIGACVGCLLYTSLSPRDLSTSRMPSSA